MKTFFALIFAALTFHTTTSLASSDFISSDLSILSIDEDSPAYSPTAYGAEIELNLNSEKIKLAVFQTMPACDAICIMLMPSPIEIELPLASIEIDECGTVFYTAISDQSDSDGLIHSLTFQDNTNRVCPTLQELPTHSVEYETFHSQAQMDTRASFIALKNNHITVVPLSSH